jgi:hypothetical protein
MVDNGVERWTRSGIGGKNLLNKLARIVRNGLILRELVFVVSNTTENRRSDQRSCSFYLYNDSRVDFFNVLGLERRTSNDERIENNTN